MLNLRLLSSWRQKRRARRWATIYTPVVIAVEPLEQRLMLSGDAILHWNEIALQAVADDHTPSIIADADQGGPTRTSRALAIVHAAMFDAFNSIDRSYTPYLISVAGPRGASVDAAVGQAAHDALVALYPQQKAVFDEALQDWLDEVPDGRAETQGIAIGRTVARAILNARQNDRSDREADYETKTEPGYHQADPLHPEQGYLTPHWGDVRPFALQNVDFVLPPPPPDLTTQEYADAFRQVYELGAIDSTTRTAEEVEIGTFWGYDGSPGLGTPPRLYNQITRTIAVQEGNSEAENARLFALVNIALADAGIASWAGKYEYDFWRPIVAIRNADLDGNEATTANADWTPLGAPASNQGGSDFTPPFPAYTSGHATFGAAALSTIAHFYGTDDISFSFTSDEFNGTTSDQYGTVRPVVTRSFDTLSEAAWENAVSRIYLGIHWSFDATAGVDQGNAVADAVFGNLFRPIRVHAHPASRPAPPLFADQSLGIDMSHSDAALEERAGNSVERPPVPVVANEEHHPTDAQDNGSPLRAASNVGVSNAVNAHKAHNRLPASTQEHLQIDVLFSTPPWQQPMSVLLV